jgi:preprotein translocase subunit SecY
MTAFVLTVGSTLLLWFGETITEKGISNGVSLLIFSSIVSGITGQVYTSVAASPNLF